MVPRPVTHLGQKSIPIKHSGGTCHISTSYTLVKMIECFPDEVRYNFGLMLLEDMQWLWGHLNAGWRGYSGIPGYTFSELLSRPSCSCSTLILAHRLKYSWRVAGSEANPWFGNGEFHGSELPVKANLLK
jgi:hypothetical protein